MAEESKAKREWVYQSGARTLAVSLTTLGLSTLVGYRHADGVPEDDLMPKAGPVPLEGVIGLATAALTLTGWVGQGYVGSAVAGVTDGCAGVFFVSTGQSLGHKLHEAFKGTGGLLPGTAGKRERAQLDTDRSAPKAEIRDANGRHMEVRKRVEQPSQEF